MAPRAVGREDAQCQGYPRDWNGNEWERPKLTIAEM